MRRAADGDVPAFSELVDRYSGRLYRVDYRLMCDAQEAEDAVQDCFTRLRHNAPRWAGTGAGLLTWHQRVTVNHCRDTLWSLRIVPDADIPAVDEVAQGAEWPLTKRGGEA